MPATKHPKTPREASVKTLQSAAISPMHDVRRVFSPISDVHSMNEFCTLMKTEGSPAMLEGRGKMVVLRAVGKICMALTTDSNKAEDVTEALSDLEFLAVLALRSGAGETTGSLSGGRIILCMVGWLMGSGGGWLAVEKWVHDVLGPFVVQGFYGWEVHNARVQAWAVQQAKLLKGACGEPAFESIVPVGKPSTSVPSSSVPPPPLALGAYTKNKNKKRKRDNGAGSGAGSSLMLPQPQGKRQKKGKGSQAGKSFISRAYESVSSLLSYD